MFQFILSISLIFSSAAFAQIRNSKSKIEAKSLREQALHEAAVSAKEEKSAASDAQISGTMLKLEDPLPPGEVRAWKYFAALTVQEFQAQGYVQTDLGQQFNLNANDQTLLPGLEFGVLTPTWAMGQANLTLGAKLKGAYTSQHTTAVMKSGFVIDDARLNTSLLSAGPTMSLGHEAVSWLSLNLGAQFGDLSYTQTSGNHFAQFTRHASFTSYVYGMGFQLSPRWSLSAEWNSRTLNGSQTVALQSNNFELGTQITW